MKTAEQVKQKIVKQWLAKAERDLSAAKALLGGKKPFYGIVGFHAQQASEKYLKAYLTQHQIEFPKTHDLKELLNLIATKNLKLADLLQDIVILTKYAVEARYPGDFPEPSKVQAEEAVALAEKVKKAILIKLKKEK